MNSSQPRLTAWARRICASGIGWPKEMVAVFTMPPQAAPHDRPRHLRSIRQHSEMPPGRAAAVLISPNPPAVVPTAPMTTTQVNKPGNGGIY